MEHVVGSLLPRAEYTVAAAESCTGGLLTSRLTDVPEQLRVPCSWPSSRTAIRPRSMCWACRKICCGAWRGERAGGASDGATEMRTRAGTTLGIGITGIAGPGALSPTSQWRSAAIAVEGPWGSHVHARLLIGSREHIKFWATQAALDDVRRLLLRERQQDREISSPAEYACACS